MALHAVVQDVGHALGALLLACRPRSQRLPAPTRSSSRSRWGWPCSCRRGSMECRATAWPGVAPPVVASRSILHDSAANRQDLRPLPLDSFAGGFLASALLAWFFFERFGVGVGTVAALFAAARVANALSHLGPPGWRGASAWSIRWSSPTCRRASCSPPCRCSQLRDRRGALPAARGTGRDGRADPPVVRPRGRAARRAHLRLGATHLVRTLGWAVGPGRRRPGCAPARVSARRWSPRRCSRSPTTSRSGGSFAICGRRRRTSSLLASRLLDDYSTTRLRPRPSSLLNQSQSLTAQHRRILFFAWGGLVHRLCLPDAAFVPPRAGQAGVRADGSSNSPGSPAWASA